MIKAFPKIFQVGTRYVQNIFEDNVIIEEKIDGSQFSFFIKDGELICRSKGKIQEIGCPDKLFQEAIDYLKSIKSHIPQNFVFYCEYLKKPKHNTLAYNRIPKNHLILFGIHDLTKDIFIYDRYDLSVFAHKLQIEIIPTLFEGKIKSSEELMKFLEKESILGGQKIEGIVVKNYKKDLIVGGQIIPIMCAKFVSEEFKEVHQKTWKKENTSGGKWESFKEQYRTEARWNKAIIHLKEKGELDSSPKDIGKLMKEVQTDISEECKEEIKNFLWKQWGQELLKNAVKGLPEYYKEKLVKESFK